LEAPRHRLGLGTESVHRGVNGRSGEPNDA